MRNVSHSGFSTGGADTSRTLVGFLRLIPAPTTASPRLQHTFPSRQRLQWRSAPFFQAPTPPFSCWLDHQGHMTEYNSFVPRVSARYRVYCCSRRERMRSSQTVSYSLHDYPSDAKGVRMTFVVADSALYIYPRDHGPLSALFQNSRVLSHFVWPFSPFSGSLL